MPGQATAERAVNAPPKRELLIRLTPVLEIIRAALWTGRLADERPVSVLLIAEQESAKTEAMKFFQGTRTIHFLSDLTSRGITPHKPAIERGEIRHLILLDLVRILSHGRGVTERCLQTCAALMEEGESETSDGGGQSQWVPGTRCGFIMGVTPKFFSSKRGRWRETGFLTRFIPVSFEYSKATVKEIHKAIASGLPMPQPHPENIPAPHFQIELPPQHALTIARRAAELGEQMKTYGFRYHRRMRSLAKAQARISGRGTVNTEDIGKLMAWSQFFTEKPIEL